MRWLAEKYVTFVFNCIADDKMWKVWILRIILNIPIIYIIVHFIIKYW